MRLTVEHLAAGYHGRNVVEDVSFTLDSGQIVCLLGPNGSGKTTLFKTILGLLRPSAGRICADGVDIGAWPQSHTARLFGYVPQVHASSFEYTVRDVVVAGRCVHLGLFSTPGRRDRLIVDAVLERLNIAAMADALYTEISGGERQMVLIARALAQQTQILVMDEPASNLDFGNQLKVLRCVRELAESGLAVLMTTHFPDHAFACATQVALLKHGRLLACSDPRQAMTEALLSETYDVPLRVVGVEDESRLRMVVPCM